jgi:hypothetical protein
MVVVGRVSFHRRHLNQAVSVYTGLPAVPPGIIKSGPFFQVEGDSVQVLAFYRIQPESAEEALATVRDRYACFTTIPDFRCDIQEWREFREFLADWVE